MAESISSSHLDCVPAHDLKGMVARDEILRAADAQQLHQALLLLQTSLCLKI